LGVEEYPREAAAVLLIELDGHAREVEGSDGRWPAGCAVEAGRRRRCARPASRSSARARLLEGAQERDHQPWGAASPVTTCRTAWCRAASLPQGAGGDRAASAPEHGLAVANVFHAGDGNLHPLVPVSARRARGRPNGSGAGRGDPASSASRPAAASAASTASAATSAATWIGCSTATTRPRCCWCAQAFDPGGLANPGKVFPTPRSCAESARRVQVLQAEGVSLPAGATVF
jgi:glycolate oxidase